ncbi:unnamed protein product [Paramecium pentaurelia]|uniref:Tubulin/FtsZ GTPase domain-containing protein n=1 Tax=Paramecium pentaurelia TaxID=43138 RepID=A0A8S1SRM8_9CILI|nr:unnamed protein product [Paramecium pentaurelia]
MSSSIHIHIGGAGVMIGDLLWKLYQKEQKDTKNQHYIYSQQDDDYYPRVVFIDLDDRMINEVKKNKQIHFKKRQFITGKEDASNNYFRGQNLGRNLIYDCLESIQKEVEKIDYLDQFLIISSISGGTGSGFTSLLLEKLTEDYGKKILKNAFVLYPSSLISNNLIDSYNAVFSTHMMTEYCNSVVAFDNQSIYNVIDNQIGLDYVDYTLLNNVIAQVISMYTGIRRHTNTCNDMIFSNMCPYPTLHFLIPSYGLLRSINDDIRKENEKELLKLLIKKDSKLFQCSMNPSYLSTTLIYRSKRIHNIYFRRNEYEISNIQHQFNNNSNIFLCESSNYQVLSELAELKSTAVFLSNDAAIYKELDNLGSKFDRLYAKRAFIHWFVNEGLESGELTSAREDLAALIKDYQDFANPIDQGYFDELNG